MRDLERPCMDCPFRTNTRYALTRSHASSILRYRGPFPCHKTVDYYSQRGWKKKDIGDPFACAGRLALEAAEQTGIRKDLDIVASSAKFVEMHERNHAKMVQARSRSRPPP